MRSDAAQSSLFAEPWQRHADDWLCDVDVGLDDDQRVYRIIDVFAFADYWASSQMRVSRADQFDDPNEGIEQLLTELAISRPGSCMIMSWSDRASARETHSRRRSAAFISSWTTAPDSVAMWALYSPDRLGICVESTVGALRRAAMAFARPRSLLSLDQSHIGQTVTLCTRVQLSRVDYRPLSQLRLRAERLARAYDRVYARYAQSGRRIPFVTDMTVPQLERYHARHAAVRFAPFSLKDASFSHEAEIRVVLQFGTETVTTRELESRDHTAGSDAERMVVHGDLSAWRLASKEALPSHEWLSLPTSHVRSVALDPRMQSHRAKFWREWLAMRAVPVRKSETFGYALEDLSVFPRLRGPYSR